MLQLIKRNVFYNSAYLLTDVPNSTVSGCNDVGVVIDGTTAHVRHSKKALPLHGDLVGELSGTRWLPPDDTG